MPECPFCTKLVSDWVQFLYGWGAPESETWIEFQAWLNGLEYTPAWVRFIKPTNRARQLWNQFHPENDSANDAWRSVEECRHDIAEFFRNQIERSSDLDGKFFDGFAQMGADPFHWVKKFREVTGLSTWKDVIDCLGSICLNVTNLRDSYRPEQMNQLSKPFWEKIRGQPKGRELCNAIQEQPRQTQGRAPLRTAFYILQSCGRLKTGDMSFSEWVENDGLLTQLENAENWNGPIEHLAWRKQWSRISVKPWDAPALAYGELKGISDNTFEYILRDHHYEGCLNLFKADSTNLKFLGKTSLGNHADGAVADAVHSRKEYWKALCYSGALACFPIAVINMAIYLAVSEGEGMGLIRAPANELVAYRFLPSDLRTFYSVECTGQRTCSDC